MSVEAISWAFNLAPVPRDHNGKRNPACKAVLIGLANHAGPDGKDAFPSVRTLVRYTDLSERTVRTALDRLEAEGTIQPCDPAVVAAKIKRADHRPQGWDLSMQLIRDDLEDEDLAALENQFPGLTARVRAVRKAGSDRPDSGVQPLHPAPETAVDNDADEVQPLHPAARTGCNRRSDGVQPFPERGAVVAPEPSIEPSREPSAAPPRTRARPGPVENSREAAEVGEFFAALGPQWPLTAGQRDRLALAVAAALAAGWPPQELASFVGANVAGVRNAYAVLASRLSPDELPALLTAATSPSPPPWCGVCDQGTRMMGWDGDAPRPCPACKPPSGETGARK
ncbi:MAG TPA: helix-turn-helix domain-containing protein [Trebonia sp.]|nr:helix-turn-helix domain-containing protein [Trebonia sp.]